MNVTPKLFYSLIVILVFSSVPARAQTTAVDSSVIDKLAPPGPNLHMYRMNALVSGGFSVVATAANIYAIPNVIKSKKDITDDELKSLNPNAIRSFDNWTLDQDVTQRDNYYKASDYVLPALVLSAGVLMADKKIKKDWPRILLMYYETHSITFSIYNFSPFGPALQNKIRPVAYYDELPKADRNGGNQRNSLYSGHTASAAAATFFIVKVYSDYHPELGNKKYLLYGLASIPPLAEGYLRVKALAHFPSDVLVGFVIGAACGIAVPAIHKFHNKDMSLGVVPTPAGMGLSLNCRIN